MAAKPRLWSQLSKATQRKYVRQGSNAARYNAWNKLSPRKRANLAKAGVSRNAYLTAGKGVTLAQLKRTGRTGGFQGGQIDSATRRRARQYAKQPLRAGAHRPLGETPQFWLEYQNLIKQGSVVY